MIEYKAVDPARIEKVEQEVVSIRDNVQEIKQTVAILDERQQRFHDDVSSLDNTLQSTNNQLRTLNRWADKKGAFVAGAVAVIGVLAGGIGLAITIFKDWLDK